MPISKKFVVLDNELNSCYNECSKVFCVIKVISKRNKMVKSTSFFVFRVIITVIVFVFVLLPCGCSSYEQMGETAAEGHRRHLRNSRINRQQLMADLDMFWLIDKPSKLTDKRIP